MADTFDTYDIGIAATFVLIGLKMSAMEREDTSIRFRRGRVVFRFGDKTQAQETLNQFLCGKLTVDPHELITKMNEFRRVIHNKEDLPVAAPPP